MKKTAGPSEPTVSSSDDTEGGLLQEKLEANLLSLGFSQPAIHDTDEGRKQMHHMLAENSADHGASHAPNKSACKEWGQASIAHVRPLVST
jgi:hypothetical protein